MSRVKNARYLHYKAYLSTSRDLKASLRFLSSFASLFMYVACSTIAIIIATIVVLAVAIIVANLLQLLSLSCLNHNFFYNLYFQI